MLTQTERISSGEGERRLVASINRHLMADSWKMKSLIDIVKENDIYSATRLLEDRPELVNSKEKEGRFYSALHYAAQLGLREMTLLLLVSNANPNNQDNHGDTPLHIAAGLGDLDIVKLLLEAGANPRVPNNSGYSAFNAALNSKNKDVIRLLRSIAFPTSR